MRRTGHALMLISGVSACSKVPPEYPGRYPPPTLHGIPPIPNNLIPADYTPPSYRVPLLTTHRALIDTFSVTNDDTPAAFVLEELLRKLNYTVELQERPHPVDIPPCPFTPDYNVLAWPNHPSSSPQTRDLPDPSTTTQLPNQQAPPTPNPTRIAIGDFTGLAAHLSAARAARAARKTPPLQRSLHNRVLLTAHINTYANWFPYALNTSYIPRNATVDYAALSPATYILGRGAVEAKAAIAAQIVAVSDLVASGAVAPDSVALLFVSGGHTGFPGGLRRFSEETADRRRQGGEGVPGGERVRAVIFGEPTGGKLACGARGWVSGYMSVEGKENGDGRRMPGLLRGVVERVVERVDGRGFGGSERFGETKVRLGEVSSSPGIRGLTPEYAYVGVEVEVARGDMESGAEMVADEIRRVAVGGKKGEPRGLEVVFRDGGIGPIACECDVQGFETMIAQHGTDMRYLEGNYVPYLYGPGSAHSPEGYEEGLTVKELEDGVEGYQRLIMHALETPFPPPNQRGDTCPIR